MDAEIIDLVSLLYICISTLIGIRFHTDSNRSQAGFFSTTIFYLKLFANEDVDYIELGDCSHTNEESKEGKVYFEDVVDSDLEEVEVDEGRASCFYTNKESEEGRYYLKMLSIQTWARMMLKKLNHSNHLI